MDEKIREKSEVLSLDSNNTPDLEKESDEDDDDDDSDDERTGDYLLNSLLSRGTGKPSLSNLSLDNTGAGRPGLGRSELDRTYSNRSLRSTGKHEELDRTHSSRSLSCNDRGFSARSLSSNSRAHSSRSLDSDDSLDDGGALTSVHSTVGDLPGDILEKKAWDTMDSVHSGTQAMSDFGNGSMDFNDSCCSFASFGGSDSDLDNSASDLGQQRAAFTSLAEQPTPRRMMLKSQSVRGMKRGMSFRGTGLSLIEESNSLD